MLVQANSIQSKQVTVLSDPSRSQRPADLSVWHEISSLDHFWFSWRFSKLCALFAQYKEKMRGKRFIEIGCGQGLLAASIAKEFDVKMDGIDLNMDALVLASQSSTFNNLYFYDILEQNLTLKHRYDACVLFDVIEHINNETAFLEAVCFHLNTHGFVLVNVPARMELYSEYDRTVGHIRRYTLDSLTNILNKSGFEVLDISYWGFFLYPIAIARKVNLALRRGATSEVIIRQGFQSPQWSNSILKACGRLETKLFRYAPIGTSVMAIAKRT